MARKYTFHRENCDCFIRKVVIDAIGRTVILGGQHAFEWTITIKEECKIIKYTFPNGKKAREEFKKYQRKH